MKKLLLHASMALVLLLVPHVHFGQAPNLGAAASFAVFTGAGAFDNFLNTVITGDIGTHAGPFTGFPPGVVIGQIHIADAVSAQAKTAVGVAFAQLAGTTCGAVIGVGLGNGQTLTPGVYCTGAASTLTGNLNLDAQGDPNALFIIQIDGALASTTAASVTLLNGASACNVYWQINGAVALGPSTAFVGTALINGAISLAASASVQGRLLSRAGAITLTNNLISIGALPVASSIVANSATTFCAGGSVTLSGNVGGVWSTGATTPSIVVTTSGDYYVTNTNSCGAILSNHIIVTVKTPPVANAGANQVICPGSTTTLTANAPVEGTGMWSVLSGPSTSIAQFSNPSSPVSFFTPAGGAGVYVLTWTVTNPPCPPASSNVTITVANVAPPSIICPLLGTVQVNALPNQCCAVVNFGPATATDNCGGLLPVVIQTGGLPSGSCFTGTSQVTFQATSGGLMSTCSFTVNVNDVQAPTILCPANIVRYITPGFCDAVVTYDNPTLSDNCLGVTSVLTTGLVSGVTFPIGVTVITFEASDGATPPNKAICIFTVTVVDNQRPTITCPPNQTKSTDPGLCTALVTYPTPTATDNCTPPPPTLMQVSGGVGTVIGVPNSTATFNKGITTVIWKATDAAGLTRTCSFRVIVNDTEPPVANCPPPIIAVNTPGLCSSVQTYPNATFTDNCPGGVIQRISGLASGSTFPVGVSIVVFKATDAMGLMKTCSFTVTVTDTELPTITCPGDLALTGVVSDCSLCTACCHATVVYPNPTFADNCGGATSFLLIGPASGSIFPAGLTTVTWQVTDAAGLVKICAFTVTVTCPVPRDAYDRAPYTGNESSDKTSGLALRLAPNPASAEVQILMEGLGETGGVLTLFNAQGSMTWRQSVDKLEGTPQQTQLLHLSDFPPGLYRICLRTERDVVTKALMVTGL